MNVALKLYALDPTISYQCRTLDDLNGMAGDLNSSKDKLSSSLHYYLQKYRQYLDIPRLCRALAVPGELAENFIMVNNISKDGSDQLRHIGEEIYHTLQDLLRNSNTNLSYLQGQAVNTDINELSVYAKMYYDIDLVKSNPMIADEYADGNPFDHVLDIMRNGGIIVRFKYVSRDGSKPEENVVSYHPMKHEAGTVLGVHVQGDPRFSMCKRWGEGDEKLLPLYEEYKGTIIRWGRDDVEAALQGRKENTEYLY